ncbi:MAG: PEP-CTERM sorting domain-containing protein [bacterium]
MSRTRCFRRALGAASLVLTALVLPAVVSAQSSTTIARGIDQFLGTPCLMQATSTGSAFSTCLQVPVQGGQYTSSAVSDNSLRSMGGQASIFQADLNHPLAAYAEGTGTQDNMLFVTGTSGANDQLVFHFSTTLTSVFNGTFDPTTTTTLGVLVTDYTSNPSYSQITYNSFSSTAIGQNYLFTPGGVDLSLGFAAFTGSYFYAMLADAAAFETYSVYSGNNTTLVSGIDAVLTGIDDVDANGNVMASAVFNPDGSATMDIVTTTTPEPGSFALVGTGLLVASVSRRRRSTQS